MLYSYNLDTFLPHIYIATYFKFLHHARIDKAIYVMSFK